MPLYHVHVAKGRKAVDPRAVELPDVESAKRYAERLAGGLTMLSRGFGIRYLGDWYVQVTDGRGKTLTQCHVPAPPSTPPHRNRTQTRRRRSL